MKRGWEEAVLRGSIDDLSRLLAAGADINARNANGQTSLMLAAAAGRADVVEWLAARGAGLDHTAKYGLSALMLAVVRGHVDVVRILKDAGASISLRGTGAPGFSGKTALDLSIARDDPEMVDVLRSATEDPHQ